MVRNVDTACFIVDMRDPQAFTAGLGFSEATSKEGLGGGKAV